MRIERPLITGGGGQLASDLAEQLAARGEVTALPRAQLDVTDDAQVDAVLAAVCPDVVFNCAAFHNVDICEQAEDQALATNVRAVKRLAERCRATGAKLVHMSTNYVFDGTRDEPYSEHDQPNPRSVYALSKLAGEYAARGYAPRALIVRSAGLYGLHGSASKGGNFVTRILARAGAQARLQVVDDQRLNPTFTADLAGAMIQAVHRDAEGVLHLTNSGACSWHEFTLKILELAETDAVVEPVATMQSTGSADRPRNGALTRPAADTAGVPRLRPWQVALADYMQQAGLLPAQAA